MTCDACGERARVAGAEVAVIANVLGVSAVWLAAGIANEPRRLGVIAYRSTNLECDPGRTAPNGRDHKPSPFTPLNPAKDQRYNRNRSVSGLKIDA